MIYTGAGTASTSWRSDRAGKTTMRCRTGDKKQRGCRCLYMVRAGWRIVLAEAPQTYKSEDEDEVGGFTRSFTSPPQGPMNLNLGSFNREPNRRSSRSGFISGLCVAGNPRKNQILIWNKLEEQTPPFNQENALTRLQGEVSRCQIPTVSLLQQLPATPQRGQTPLGRAPSVPPLRIISMNKLLSQGSAPLSLAGTPASTQHLQHPLERVHHLRGALCNLPGRAFERAALTYLQMALIRLACLFKHQKTTPAVVSGDWEKVTDRAARLERPAHFCYPPGPSCNSSAEGKQSWRHGRGQRDTN